MSSPYELNRNKYKIRQEPLILKNIKNDEVLEDIRDPQVKSKINSILRNPAIDKIKILANGVVKSISKKKIIEIFKKYAPSARTVYGWLRFILKVIKEITTLYADLAMQPWISAVVVTWLEWYSPSWLRAGMSVMNQVKSYMNNAFFSITKIGSGLVTGEGPPIRTLLWNAFTGDREANFQLQYGVKDDASYMDKLWGSLMGTLDSEQIPKIPATDYSSIAQEVLKMGGIAAGGIALGSGLYAGYKYIKGKWEGPAASEDEIKKKFKSEMLADDPDGLLQRAFERYESREAEYKRKAESDEYFENLKKPSSAQETEYNESLKKLQEIVDARNQQDKYYEDLKKLQEVVDARAKEDRANEELKKLKDFVDSRAQTAEYFESLRKTRETAEPQTSDLYYRGYPSTFNPLLNNPNIPFQGSKSNYYFDIGKDTSSVRSGLPETSTYQEPSTLGMFGSLKIESKKATWDKSPQYTLGLENKFDPVINTRDLYTDSSELQLRRQGSDYTHNSNLEEKRFIEIPEEGAELNQTSIQSRLEEIDKELSASHYYGYLSNDDEQDLPALDIETNPVTQGMDYESSYREVEENPERFTSLVPRNEQEEFLYGNQLVIPEPDIRTGYFPQSYLETKPVISEDTYRGEYRDPQDPYGFGRPDSGGEEYDFKQFSSLLPSDQLQAEEYIESMIKRREESKITDSEYTALNESMNLGFTTPPNIVSTSFTQGLADIPEYGYSKPKSSPDRDPDQAKSELLAKLMDLSENNPRTQYEETKQFPEESVAYQYQTTSPPVIMINPPQYAANLSDIGDTETHIVSITPQGNEDPSRYYEEAVLSKPEFKRSYDEPIVPEEESKNEPRYDDITFEFELQQSPKSESGDLNTDYKLLALMYFAVYIKFRNIKVTQPLYYNTRFISINVSVIQDGYVKVAYGDHNRKFFELNNKEGTKAMAKFYSYFNQCKDKVPENSYNTIVERNLTEYYDGTYKLYSVFMNADTIAENLIERKRLPHYSTEYTPGLLLVRTPPHKSPHFSWPYNLNVEEYHQRYLSIHSIHKNSDVILSAFMEIEEFDNLTYILSNDYSNKRIYYNNLLEDREIDYSSASRDLNVVKDGLHLKSLGQCYLDEFIYDLALYKAIYIILNING